MTQENALKIFKSLSDMSRLRIVQSLTQGDMYTELLAERLELTRRFTGILVIINHDPLASRKRPFLFASGFRVIVEH